MTRILISVALAIPIVYGAATLAIVCGATMTDSEWAALGRGVVAGAMLSMWAFALIWACVMARAASRFVARWRGLSR
jgi:hypothetical protein